MAFMSEIHVVGLHIRMFSTTSTMTGGGSLSSRAVCSLPSILESTLRPSLSGGPGLQLYVTCYNTIFLFILAAVIYGMVRPPCVIAWSRF
jgi:hypothetical protein